MRPDTWLAKKHAYMAANVTEAWEPVGVLLDETEEDILEEVRFDINFKQEVEW